MKYNYVSLGKPKTFIRPFEAPQRIVEIKIQINFLSSSGIETEKVNVPLAERWLFSSNK